MDKDISQSENLSSSWERVGENLSDSTSSGSMSSAGDKQPFWKGQEDIVITGVSGRYPLSENVDEFKKNLYEGIDMVTESDGRWPPGFYDLPKRHGKLRELKKFDAQFFGVTPKQANYMDPQVRILLETVYEAIIDSGCDPQELRGSKTGVFVGCSASETGGALTQDPETVTGYTLTGCVRSMFSNRISFAFDFRGPSFSVDTACSSSCLALQLALDAIRQDQCNAAIVAGAHLTLTPTAALQFLRLGMLSDKGSCRSFDESGDGYCRTEGVAAIFLQRSSNAKRIYATIVHAKSNTDGYKEQGITFPSGERQANLLEEVYREADVDPNTVTYVETHGTGTKVGDPQEANAIASIFCSNRSLDKPLLIGSVKSNMGHAEPASGICSITKVILAMENQEIPPNLHYNEPNPYIPGLVDGKLKVVSVKTPFEGGYIGINSFGFGGSNTHVILKAADHIAKPVAEKASIPKVIIYSGRTQESVNNIFKNVEEHKEDQYFHALLANQAHLSPKDTPFRGFMLLDRVGNQDQMIDIQKVPVNEPRPIYFIYSGMGSQWSGMAQGLMKIEFIDQSLRASSKCLEEYGIDVYAMLQKSDPALYQNNTLNCMLAICAIQIAITDALFMMGIIPAGILGHSTGEMGCGYCDGALTRDQTMKLAYHRGKSIMTSKLPIEGGMAAIGLTWEETAKRCPEGVVPACHNGLESVTISGEADKVQKFVDELTKEEIFAKFVDSSGIPFHSPIMLSVKDSMLNSMKTAIDVPKLRSSKWISTSIPESEKDSQLAQYCSAEYHVNNACSPVLFYEALQQIPTNAITIEIAPHALLQAVLRRNLDKSCTNIGMVSNRADDELDFFLQAVGKIYQAGGSIHPERLYPEVHFPVPIGTPMLGSMWRWDHSQDWPVIDGKMLSSGGGGQVAATASYTIDPFAPESKDAYLLDHCIDGRVLYPFTGHMCLAWKTLCKLKGVDFQTTSVVMENINVYKATILTKPIRLDVVITPGNGQFEILDDDQICASGRIFIPDETQLPYYDQFQGIQTSPLAERIELGTEDAYKEFLLRGYEYGPSFRGIYKTCNSGERGTLYWNGNWVTFLDSLLQTALLAERADTLRLPTRVRYLRVDPVKQLENIQEVDGLNIIELRNDISTNGCVAGGVECCDLTSNTVSRRLQIQGQLFTEKIFHIKHFDLLALQENFTKEAQILTAYKQSLRTIICKGLKNWKDIGILKDFSKAATLAKALEGLKCVNYTLDPVNHRKYLENTEFALFNTLDDVFNMKKGKEDDASDFETNVVNKIKASYKIFDCDTLWAAALVHDRIFKIVQDIIIENSASHKNKAVALELTSTEQLRYCVNAINSHPLLEVDWTAVGPNVNDLDENTLSQFGAKKLSLNLDDGDVNLGELKNLDYIVMDKVLNKKTNPLAYLEKCKEILRDDGFIIIVDYTSEFDLIATVEALNGRDFDLSLKNGRSYGSFFTHDALVKLFTEAGFVICNYQSDPSIMSTVYAIRKQPAVAREPVIVNVDDIKTFTWIEELQNVIEERLNEPDTKTIWLENTTVRNNGVVGMALCFNEENLKHNRFRTFVDMSSDIKTRDGPAVIDINTEEGKRIMALDLHANNYKNGNWGSMRHIVVKDEDAHVYKQCEHAFINTLVRGDVSSLTWFESPNQYFNVVPNKLDIHKLCSVYFAAINFRDVMLAYGRLPPDAIPGNFADRECLLGMEFSGRLEDGKRLMGILPAQALATTVVVDTEYAWEVPESWTLAEAATVPVVYATAYYALVIRGQIQEGESVLIHGGSGGVGQAAIAIALSYGCEVFTTVGSEEKKNFLKERFPQLQERHFANSRRADFEAQIRRTTRGRGVDVILNSLAQDMLQASVRCLAQHGRFLEIGKVDLSQNNPLGMAVFLKNVTFHGILLDAIMDASVGNKKEWLRVAALLEGGIKSGVVQPLPYSTFGAEKAEDAFRFMSAGKHIGKVLMQIREEEEAKNSLPSVIRVKAICRTLCNPTHVYLITGGLGGFGLELCQWLINRGARNIVLTSRSGIRTGYQARCIHFWRRTGVNVMVSTLNISIESEAFALIEQCNEMGPLGGVFHLAMVLRDCLFENQTVQNFVDAAEAKYHGTIHLDYATRKLADKNSLRWFVVFSSITSGRGNAGQTNYGWSNCTMERMIDQRREDGFPGIAIQWGAIGDVGVILENMGDNNTVVGGTLPQRMPSCLATFDLFLSWNHAIVSSYIKAETGGKKAAGGGNLLQTIAHILGVNDVSQLNPDANLGDLGLDSLMGVEIKQALERDYDIVLSMKDIRTLTLNKLQSLAESGGTSSDVLQSSEADMLKDAEKEAEQNTVEVLEKQMNQLFKMRVDVNDLEPEDMVVKCNKVVEGPTVFFVHSIEGIATPLKKVMNKCNFPAYCFQATKSTPQDSIESVAARYIKEMKKIQPQGPYRIIGYSYGACIGFEMATMLQVTDGETSVERLILLDGSHLYMQTYRNVYRMAFGVTGDTLVNNPLFESEIMCAMTLRFANVDYKKFRVELLQLPGFKARIQKVVETVMQTGLFKSPDTIQFACEAMRSKFLMADKYKPERKFNGLITLIRAEQGAAREEDVGQDYGISQVSEESKVFTVEGDHDTFVQGKTSVKTVEIINNLIFETYKS
uniref:Carrier domain-containing protein n=1 Tax=Rhabditophanes sp. KR3021 TaxID=114890 RepID=A0AC35U6Z3_9BILA